jgi:carboxyl-terminal processing protease
MNREKIAWLVSLVLIAMLAFQLPGTLARRDDEYAFVKTLIDLHRQVDNNYVDPVDEDKLQLGSINGMMGELDPYSVYIPPARQKEFENMLEGSFEGVGIELSQLDNGDIQVVSPIPDSPALKAGVMAGDIITKVNGQELHGEKIVDVQKLIKGPLGSDVKLTVRHVDGREQELTMKREQIVLPTVMGYRRDSNNNWDFWVSQNPKVAYIRITQFTSDTFTELKKATDQVLASGIQGLILDIRFNPGGRLDQAEAVVNLFVRSGVIVRTKGLHRAEQIATASPEKAIQRDFPMIVLVNEHSASAAEIVAGSLKDNKRALIVGNRTYGKGSVQEIIPMEEDGGELKLTVAYYYLPSGRLVHRRKGATDWGVDPQINVPMSEEAEQKVLLEESENQLFHKPLPITTRPTTGPASTQPTSVPATQPVVDTQLQQAVSTMIGFIVLNGEKEITDIPTTQPVTADTQPSVPASAK